MVAQAGNSDAGPATEARPGVTGQDNWSGTDQMSNRSRFITLSHADTKSATNFSLASSSA
ncbi:hypothetical protein D7316_01195 [Gordonia insulae]|uniref:Uncharacterized protein n=1 Tax=Gordonia insulae TaxID=2420509 RepID=A0A3G8JJD9_9ACTN|nr:hypothetical protein D7316_01195 [Gordonia insulae]